MRAISIEGVVQGLVVPYAKAQGPIEGQAQFSLESTRLELLSEPFHQLSFRDS